MTTSEERRRIVIALTESSPVPELWQEAMQALGGTPGELITLFLEDDRWYRVASLPFTREVSRLGGTPTEFTRQRAEQLRRDAAARVRRVVEQLAKESKLETLFEALAETDQLRITEVVGSGQFILIAPSFLARRPIYAHFERLGCRIRLIEVPETGRSGT